MVAQVTVTLPNEVYRQAERIAQLSQTNVGEVLTASLSAAFAPNETQPNAYRPLEHLSDNEVVKLAESTMDAALDQRLATLSQRRKTGRLKPKEAKELEGLMKVYSLGQVRKAQAMREAVTRGLLELP